MKNEGDKSEDFRARDGAPLLHEHHKSSSKFFPMVRHASHSKKSFQNFEGWRPAPFKALGVPITPFFPHLFLLVLK